ncbi:MAG: hypothetical protein ACRDA3_05180 [Peptostreptococcaceae bacterium]
MKRGINSYPKNLYRFHINSGRQDCEIFYAYSELSSIELSDYLADNLYLILSDESIFKSTIIPSSRIIYVEEISAKNTNGDRVYHYDGIKDSKCSYDSTIAYRLITSF